ncbi:hypothetical protein EJB05_18098, partial [Eragrostis curvula]
MSGPAFIPPFCACARVSQEKQHGHLHRPLLVVVDDLAYREMEEGVPLPVKRDPTVLRPSYAVWKCFNIFYMCLTTVLGMAMLAFLFASRFVYHDNPTPQDPFKMIALTIIALCVMGTGYIPTLNQYCGEL